MKMPSVIGTLRIIPNSKEKTGGTENYEKCWDQDSIIEECWNTEVT